MNPNEPRPTMGTDRPERGAPATLPNDDPTRLTAERTAVGAGDDRADPARWSSVWAGLLVALASFLLLELLFFAFGWLTLDNDGGSTAGWVTALIGLVAFLIGGMTAGASSIWYGAREGVLQGILVWALGVVGILLLSLLGGGALFGAASGLFADLASVQNGNLPEGEVSQAVESARDGAGWAVAGLVAYLAAAAGGGALGVKMGAGQHGNARHR